MPLIPYDDSPHGFQDFGLPTEFSVSGNINAQPKTGATAYDWASNIAQNIEPIVNPFSIFDVFQKRDPNSVASAAMRQGNLMENAALAIRQQYEDGSIGPADPQFNPIDQIAGTDLEPYGKEFLGAINQKDFTRRAMNLRQEIKDKQQLAQAGGLGVFESIFSGAADVTSLLPGGGIIKGAKVGGVILKSAAETAVLSAGATALQEGGLQVLQTGRSKQESFANIGASALLGGLLGAGAGALTAKQFADLASKLDNEMIVPVDTADDLYGAGGFNHMSSLGAASASQDVKIKSAFGVEKVMQFQDPLIRTLSSSSKTTRVTAARLAEVPMALEGDIIAPGGAVESIVKMKQNSRLYKFETALDEAYSKYRFGKPNTPLARERGAMTEGGKYLDYTQFKEAVGEAARNGDSHIIPEVGEAARAWREHIADPGKNDAIGAGLLDADVKPETSTSYLMRLYNKQKIEAQSPRFVSMVSEWLDKRQLELKAEKVQLENDLANGKAKATKSEGANTKRIAALEEELRMSKDDHNMIAEDIKNALLGAEHGRILYRLPGSVRGPLKERTFAIPDNFQAADGTKFTDFLENDISAVARAYNRTIIPDTEMKNAFGDIDLGDTIKKIMDESEALKKAAKSDNERLAITSRRDADVRDIRAMADRIRGIYGMTGQPSGFVRAARVARSFNYLRLLGGMTISAIPDLGKLMFMGAGRTFTAGFIPMVTNFSKFRVAAHEVKMAGTALDMVMHSREMALADVLDDFGRASKFERGLQWSQKKFGVASLMSPWNATIKQIAGSISMSRVLETVTALKQGKKVSASDLQALKNSRIDDVLAERIADQFAKHGATEGGLHLPNTEKWTDSQAIEALRTAIHRDVNQIIVEPGMDKPLWLDTETGKVLGQFKSFGIASVQRTLIAGLQQRDAHVLSGLFMMMGLGALATKISADIAGKSYPESTTEWVAASFDRAGIGGWFFDANNVIEKVSRGNMGLATITGKSLPKYQNRSIVSSVLGVSAGLIEDLAQIAGADLSKDWKESDIRALRRTLPLQNLFYLRFLFDKAEKGLAQVLPSGGG